MELTRTGLHSGEVQLKDAKRNAEKQCGKCPTRDSLIVLRETLKPKKLTNVPDRARAIRLLGDFAVPQAPSTQGRTVGCSPDCPEVKYSYRHNISNDPERMLDDACMVLPAATCSLWKSTTCHP